MNAHVIYIDHLCTNRIKHVRKVSFERDQKLKKMEVLISNWSNVESVPKTYIFPLDSRPGKLEFPVCNNIPVIDLDHNHPAEIIQQVISACQKFGFFQV